MSSTATARTLGTSAVFLTAISTILGAIMFLRFGHAVAHVSLLGALAIIVIGHVVTVPTSLAISEIATNQHVAGGGAYLIISRSFGRVVGAAIGVALYFSQAISVAFYAVAFAEAFRPVFAWLSATQGIVVEDARFVSVPITLIVIGLTLWKGAEIGVKALWLVVAILFVSIGMFLFGSRISEPVPFFEAMTRRIPDGMPFFAVFAIIFPAFTGVAAGLGLSGDLKNPTRAIPIGTMAATIVGMVLYVLITLKLGMSAQPADIAVDQLIMSRIAAWGPIIPIGLAAATLSSALGSILAAPRTLQALAADEVLPGNGMNTWLAAVSGKAREPVNATLVTAVIALTFVWMGDVNFVAEIISMFFMLTHGAICSVSFLEHFAADPSYRPSFRSRWYLSLLGAVSCFALMFLMNAAHATLACIFMVVMHVIAARSNPDKRGLAAIFQGALFQVSRQLQVFVQKSEADAAVATWRPAIICLSRGSFERIDAFELLRWISHRYGFGTSIHLIEGYLSSATHEKAQTALDRLVRVSSATRSNVYLDTLVCPSSTSAVAQVVQLPGISGKPNDLVLFEAARGCEGGGAGDLAQNDALIASAGFDAGILIAGSRGFGYRQSIDLWITPTDSDNARLMVLLSFIIAGNPDWRGAEIRVFLLAAEPRRAKEEQRLAELIRVGRLPISASKVVFVPLGGSKSAADIIAEHSVETDLTLLGFTAALLRGRGAILFDQPILPGNVLFLSTTNDIEISRKDDEAPAEAAAKAPEPAPESADEA